ncbi:MAG: response regulator transcription factor [Desulfobacteraceae bacterium]|nr:response regulator transcription factor [Desulfobacteraceae bacterium]
MTEKHPTLTGKHILAVDDEEDILESIEDILEMTVIDTARDYASASEKLRSTRYDLVVLDIMGVNGLQLLEEAVARGMPTVMLTAHAVNPDTLMESIRKGAISYLPKETLAELDDMLEALLSAHERGEPPWKLLFDKLGDYFNERFGEDWKEKDKVFWKDFSRTWQVGRGIQQRLMQDERVRDKGF